MEHDNQVFVNMRPYIYIYTQLSYIRLYIYAQIEEFALTFLKLLAFFKLLTK